MLRSSTRNCHNVSPQRHLVGAENHGKGAAGWMMMPSGVTETTSQLHGLPVCGDPRSRDDEGKHKHFATVIPMHLCLPKTCVLECHCPGIFAVRLGDFSKVLLRASLAAWAETQCQHAYTANGNALVWVTEKSSLRWPQGSRWDFSWSSVSSGSWLC